LPQQVLRLRLRMTRQYGALFAGEVDAQGGAGGFQEASHVQGEGVRDHWAFALVGADEVAEVGGLVVEAAVVVGLVEEGLAAVGIVDGGAGGVPPVGVEEDVSARGAEEGVAAAEEVEAGVELGHAALVFGLENGEVVDLAGSVRVAGCVRAAGGVRGGGAEAAHGLHALEGAEPVEGEEGFVWADAEDASASEGEEVEGVVGSEGGIAVAGAHEADGADGVALEVLAEPLVEGEEGRLHGFHEEAVVGARGGEDLLELAHVDGGGLFAEDVFSGGERGDAEVGVGVGVGGDVDSVDAFGGEERIEGGGEVRDFEARGEGLGALGGAAPDGFEGCGGNSGEALGEAGCGAAGTDDAEADGGGSRGHRIRLAELAGFAGLVGCGGSLRV
jgi:hypothetical protein